MATAAAAVMAKARRDVISHFLSRHAVSEDSAVPYTPDRRIHARQFDRLLDKGLVLSAANGGYYIDVAALDAFQRKLRKGIAGGLAIGAAIVAIIVAVGA